jgi:hypothetical protein
MKTVLFSNESEWLVTDRTPLVTVLRLEEELQHRRIMRLLLERMAEG